MPIDRSHLHRIAAVVEAGDLCFTELVARADLNPLTAFRGATLRGDLSHQDLAGFDFTNGTFARTCDLTGADLSYTRGVTPEMLSETQRRSLAREPRAWFWVSHRAPQWADDWGRDRFGPWVTLRVPGTDVTQRMRWCPPGTFMMGSPDSDTDATPDEHPQHPVSFAQGFWMFDTAVTEALWTAVMRTEPRTPLGLRFPVTDIDWQEARQFTDRMNEMLPGLELSLPPESAWEYACRAGTTTRYSFGNRVTRKQVCFSSRQPVPTASLPANPWGLHEMHGNVWEWCLDHYHDGYADAPDDGSAWLDATAAGAALRVVRGGSWIDAAALARSACRGGLDPAHRDGNLGFRCVRVRSASGVAGAAAPANPPSPAEAERAGPDGGAGAAAARRGTAPEPAPAWAVEAGTDAFGRYAVIQIPGTQVTQLLRWIEPGTFVIGSPPEEPGRFDDEGPQTEVSFSDGFWMFDAPVTQALWQAVMTTNPSAFRSPTRPVESVSHADAQTFIRRLNDLIPGLRLSLPSEAEWEYACRAGTAAATYRGDLGEDETTIARVLDAIAWYVGNSYDGFELDNGSDVSDRIGQPGGSALAGTRPVRLKAPNDWGLYDMLGNVWEWCADEWHRGYEGLPRDGTARLGTGAAYRVVRGGSWISVAANARSASRNGYDPANRFGDLGFRCVRVRSDSEAARRADGASEASGARPRRRRARREA